MFEAEGHSLGIDWPKGLLIYGPAGCGKTALVHSVAEQYGVLVKTITPAAVYGAYTGKESMQNTIIVRGCTPVTCRVV